MTDPYQAANQAVAEQSGQGANTTAPAYGPGTPAQSKDLSGVTDPFGTTKEYAGSGAATWDPRVPFDAIEGRTCILVPREFRLDAPNPFAKSDPTAKQTREEWRADLIVLDGEPFEFTYNHKESKDSEPVEKTQKVDTLPFTAKLQSIAQGQLIRVLNGIDKAPDKLFAVGVLMRVPQWRDMPKVTVETIAESRRAYVEYVQRTGKTEPDNRQRSTWGLVDDPRYLTDERMNAARSWWASVRADWK